METINIPKQPLLYKVVGAGFTPWGDSLPASYVTAAESSCGRLMQMCTDILVREGRDTWSRVWWTPLHLLMNLSFTSIYYIIFCACLVPETSNEWRRCLYYISGCSYFSCVQSLLMTAFSVFFCWTALEYKQQAGWWRLLLTCRDPVLLFKFQDLSAVDKLQRFSKNWCCLLMVPNEVVMSAHCWDCFLFPDYLNRWTSFWRMTTQSWFWPPSPDFMRDVWIKVGVKLLYYCQDHGFLFTPTMSYYFTSWKAQ